MLWHPMVIRVNQWCNFKVLRLFYIHNERKTSKYASNFLLSPNNKVVGSGNHWLSTNEVTKFWDSVGWAFAHGVRKFICTVCTHRIRWSCGCLMSIPQQIHWIQLKHLLPCIIMYNLSLLKLLCCSTLLVTYVCVTRLLF